MILDACNVDHGATLAADLCIVGAGAAGIAVAREFVNHPWRVLLLESGGTQLNHKAQSLNQGVVTGHQYPSLELCRRRVLGGSTTVWGGWCRPLDSIDFEERTWVDHSGWPFGRSELDPFYARACTVCNPLGRDNDGHNTSLGQTSGRLLDLAQVDFEDICFHVAGTRFGETYWSDLQSARNLGLILHASALEIVTDQMSKEVRSLKVGTFGGRRFEISARKFILAGGGIENPRLLLTSRAMRTAGVGNEHDVVGRFFADHLHLKLRRIDLEGRRIPEFYHLQTRGDQVFRGGMSLTEKSRRRLGLLGFAVTIHNADDPHDLVYPHFRNVGYASFRTITRAFARGRLPDSFGYHVGRSIRHFDNVVALSFRRLVKPPWRSMIIGCRAEQSPNPDSRVILENETDVFGVNKVRLDWRLTSQDSESLREARRILDKEWAFPNERAERSRVFHEQDIDFTAAAHHMGTTRMHRNPKLGVVDESCRVHGIRNLFVAGSSVFPTTGWAPPTLTVVALALRLADFVKEDRL
jgi:choline dehydrogenase-like flavoprotein